MFLCKWCLFSYQRFWMLIQTYYLFNAFSLSWNMRAVLRFPLVLFLAQAELPKYRCSFLSDHKIISNWTSLGFWMGLQISWLGLTQNRKETLCLPIWWKAASYTLRTKLQSVLSCLPILAHPLIIKILSDKGAFKQVFLFICLTFFILT